MLSAGEFPVYIHSPDTSLTHNMYKYPCTYSRGWIWSLKKGSKGRYEDHSGYKGKSKINRMERFWVKKKPPPILLKRNSKQKWGSGESKKRLDKVEQKNRKDDSGSWVHRRPLSLLMPYMCTVNAVTVLRQWQGSLQSLLKEQQWPIFPDLFDRITVRDMDCYLFHLSSNLFPLKTSLLTFSSLHLPPIQIGSTVVVSYRSESLAEVSCNECWPKALNVSDTALLQSWLEPAPR